MRHASTRRQRPVLWQGLGAAVLAITASLSPSALMAANAQSIADIPESRSPSPEIDVVIARIRALNSVPAAPHSLPGIEGDGRWLELPPPQRHWHTAVVDSKRNRIVIVSGFGWTRVNQVWEHPFDPQAQWRTLDVRGDAPSPRAYATAVYDSKRDRALLFGGFDGNTTFNEVWELQLNGVPRWRLLSPAGPAPTGRFWHSSVYDTRFDRMIVFGGTKQHQALNETWALDLKGHPRWELLAPSGDAPAPRVGACALYDPIGVRMLVVGGDTWAAHDSSQTVWALDLAGPAAWKRMSTSGPDPGPLGLGPGVLDAARSRALFYSGTGSTVLALTLSEPMTWSKLDPGSLAPSPRDGHIAVVDPTGRHMWIYGGSSRTKPRSDTWTFPLDGLSGWTKVPAQGEADRASGHTAIFESRRDRMVVYGGYPSWDGTGTERLDHRVWTQGFAEGDAWTPIEPSGSAPPHRGSHTAVYDSLHDRMVVFGGYGAQTELNDVWALNFGSNHWTPFFTQGHSPSPRSASAAIFDPVGDRMIIFGGGRLLDDTWALALHGDAVWQPILADGMLPPGRREHSAVYDPVRHRMLVFGGITTANDYDNDVWSLALDGPAAWQQIVVPGPAPRGRQSPVAVYDAERARLIVHGGYDGTNLIRDTWELSLDGEPRWRELEPAGSVPVFWFDHAAVLDPNGRRMVIFGEFGSWSLAWGSATSRSLGAHPRATASMAVEPQYRLAIAAASPLPFHGAWKMRVHLPEPGRAVIEARTVSGRLVFSREIPGAIRGSSSLLLTESAACPSGVYFMKLIQGGRVARTKVVSLR